MQEPVFRVKGWRTTRAVLEKAVFNPGLNTVKTPAVPDD
jgi:hypothetical protein